MKELDEEAVTKLLEILHKSNSDIVISKRMCRADASNVTDRYKAFDRFEAASFVFGPYSLQAGIYLQKAIDLENPEAKKIATNIHTILTYKKVQEAENKRLEELHERGAKYDKLFSKVAFYTLY